MSKLFNILQYVLLVSLGMFVGSMSVMILTMIIYSVNFLDRSFLLFLGGTIIFSLTYLLSIFYNDFIFWGDKKIISEKEEEE